jgi:GWxTD domain-containing protein
MSQRKLPLPILILILSVMCTAAFAADPASTFANARAEVAKKNYAAALPLLRSAATDAATIADAGQRNAALTAIHFYTALALAELGKEAEARTELVAVFQVQPNAALAEGSYPARFSKLFNSVKSEMAKKAEGRNSFDDAYPGFDTFTDTSSEPISRWGTSSEAILLATDEEKEQWGRLADDAARQEFINAFWQRRDPDPATPENDLRDLMQRRIAFADVAFDETGDRHGALSDRGRVFVFIGEPHRVSTRPLTPQEANSVTGRGMRGGGVELWEYRREQLPTSIPTHQVEFRFVTRGRDPERAMQRDFMALAALNSARKALNLPEVAN